jgi:hypothetical protein
MAYATLTGNSLKNYRPTDIDVKALQIQSQGCSILQQENARKQGYHIRLKITEPDFRLQIRGFDEKRELDVRLEVET